MIKINIDRIKEFRKAKKELIVISVSKIFIFMIIIFTAIEQDFFPVIFLVVVLIIFEVRSSQIINNEVRK
jgi:hypothetical protein